MERVTLSILIGGLLAIIGCRPAAPSVQPARIVSGSMAPRFQGEHWEITCNACGYPSSIGVEHPPFQMQVVCPNCGALNPVTDEDIRPGKTADVQVRDFAQQPPRRWELVAFREPGDSNRVALKRVVGLPGEHIAIRGGELYVNGELLRKSHEEYELTNLPVYWPVRAGFDRWVPETASSRWVVTDDFVQFFDWEPGQESEAKFDWLAYRHHRATAFADQPQATSRIPDDYEYNQGLARGLNYVHDVSFTPFVKIRDGGELRLRLFDGDQPLYVELRPNDNTVSLFRGDQLLIEAPSSTPLAQSEIYPVEVTFVDGQVFVSIDGELTLNDTLPQGENYSGENLSLAIGSRGRAATISEPAILRDIYYLNPQGRADNWEMESPLGDVEYFLLGDNAPISIDSRHYGAIKLSEIVGGVEPRDEE